MNSAGHRTRTLPLIVVLGVITAFDAMAIDLYLPGFRDIGRSLGANAGTMQTSLSVFVGGAAIGQLFYGPVTDRFGRRGPLAFGILLFVLASVLAALSQNMAMFMVARALQGLGAAAGLVIPRAIITDRYQGREVAKLFSALLQVMMIAPIVAPPIGGLLVAAIGWQAIFWFLALFGVASLVALLKIVPETLASSRRATAGLGVTLLDYAGLLSRGRLAWLTLSSAFAMAGLFAYIGSSSFVFVDRFGLPPAIYSLVLAGIALGMVIGGQINVLLLSRWTEHKILVFGLLLHAACCVALLIATLAIGAGVYVAGALIFLAMASLMLVVGNGIALVMKNAPTSHAGSVSSLLGVLQYAFASVSGAALALAYDATLTPFITAMLLCAVGALIAFVVATRLTAETATPFDGRTVEYP
jgi:MFS transporter, DHA1 family, multidrug resistance protein